jgi:hypothetical protein
MLDRRPRALQPDDAGEFSHPSSTFQRQKRCVHPGYKALSVNDRILVRLTREYLKKMNLVFVPYEMIGSTLEFDILCLHDST